MSHYTDALIPLATTPSQWIALQKLKELSLDISKWSAEQKEKLEELRKRKTGK